MACCCRQSGRCRSGKIRRAAPSQYGARRCLSRQHRRAAAAGRLQHAQAGLRHLLRAAIAERVAHRHARPGASRGVKHEAGRKVAQAHQVRVEPQSKLAAILREAERCRGQRDCHAGELQPSQAPEVVGDGLRLVAWCPEDGVKEAVEGTRRTTLCWECNGIPSAPMRTMRHRARCFAPLCRPRPSGMRSWRASSRTSNRWREAGASD